MADLASSRTGGCQCGGVRYAVTGEPIELFACHCLECRRQSTSAFGMSFIVGRGQFALTSGRPRRWSRRADSGRTLDCWFCPDCGSRLWHENGPDTPTLSVKAGSLDEPVDFSTAIHIWTDRRLPGFVVPATRPSYPGEPA